MIIISCKKNSTSYNYNANTTDPFSLPIGTIQADINGKTVTFDSLANTNIVYSILGNDTMFKIGIEGKNYQSSQTYQIIEIELNGWLPFDTATFYSNNTNLSAGENFYELIYLTYTPAMNAFGTNGSSVYKAEITHIDTGNVQGKFSGYAAPYNITNGGFNIKASIPASFFK